MAEKLLPFGFSQTPDGFLYSEVFMDGAFRAEILIQEDGSVSGKVFDLDSDEEYLPVQVESRTGAFVGAIREAYAEILGRIADSCFIKEPFLYAQTNRIARLIEKNYGEKSDYPFAKLPEYGVFRYPGNKKWYGLVMNIHKNLLTREKDAPGSNPLVEVLNIKIDPKKAETLLAVPGIYPGYHMKRTNWISVLLDDSVPDDMIMRLVDTSRNFAVHAGRKNTLSETHADWIIPANPKYYDLDTVFQNKKAILWKQGSKIRVGDIAYIYITAPVSAVRYKCVVTETGIPYEYKDNNVSMKQVMRMDIVKQYPDDLCPFSKLRELGIAVVRGARTVTREFLEYIGCE